MTKHYLKELAAMGAELGAAKAEVERLRGLLREAAITLDGWRNTDELDDLAEKITAALTQQAEPTDTYTAVDMATAAAQGFRDGQAAVEQAPAQDEPPQSGITIEKDVFGTVHIKLGDFDYIQIQYQYPYTDNASQNALAKRIAELLTRPAQTEHQPVAWMLEGAVGGSCLEFQQSDLFDSQRRYGGCMVPLYAAPIAQTAPQGKFRMGDLVRKTSGSEWQGRICGTYSTALTPEGYAVESEAHAGSVQIYPAKALEAVE